MDSDFLLGAAGNSGPACGPVLGMYGSAPGLMRGLGSLATTVPVILTLWVAISTLSCEDWMGLTIGDVDMEIDAALVERTKTNKYSLERT